jgi:hypothetical protein
MAPAVNGEKAPKAAKAVKEPKEAKSADINGAVA